MKCAFVSGASRGIGRAIAFALAKEGYHLGIACQNKKELLEETASLIRSERHVEVLTFVGDLSDASFVTSIATQMMDHFGRVDVVVNNAGVAHIGLLTDMTEAEWRRVLDVNLTSCFYTAKAFVPQMVARGSGRILNISSMWGSVGASCEVAYSASKGGVNAFTKALAKELAPSGIAVNALSCGVVDTQMNACFSEEERASLAAEIPAGRFATPEEVAEAAVLLIAAPSYLTGQVVSMDGGFI